MEHQIIISGFGGQGVLFAGQLLAYAGLAEGKHVTWIPSYGPEMRGGTANCTVILSDEEIGSPQIRYPSAVIALNPPSLVKYAKLVKPGGCLVLDASLIDSRAGREDVREIAVRAKEIAEGLGYPQMANVVAIGALVAATGALRMETVEDVLIAKTARKRPEMREPNLAALRAGAAVATATVH
ncbi:MAG: 2-oxoacid:acceptor oxidoreductase family protein [Thermoflexales bacterium]|nr:2-oxoacid:acceptor oxidoreductase family protein [Thermoflexales bacterium]